MIMEIKVMIMKIIMIKIKKMKTIMMIKMKNKF